MVHVQNTIVLFGTLSYVKCIMESVIMEMAIKKVLVTIGQHMEGHRPAEFSSNTN